MLAIWVCTNMCSTTSRKNLFTKISLPEKKGHVLNVDHPVYIDLIGLKNVYENKEV